MVVRVPDCKGQLYPKGRVIVPCHTVFNKQKNMLTEVTHTDDKSKLQINQVISKISNSNASNCITPENITDNENALWNRQLNRWWGWNWQRKRKECIAKFGHQNEDFSDQNRQERNVCNDQCACHIIYKKPTKNMKKQSLNDNFYIKQNNHQDPIKDSHSLNKIYHGRLKRNKHNNEYEGFLPEVSTSTDKCCKKHYLHLRVLNMHSNNNLGNNKNVSHAYKTSDKKRKNKTENVIIRSDSDVVDCQKDKNDQNSVKINTNELSTDKKADIIHSFEFAPCSKHTSSRISVANASKNTSSTQHAIAEDLNVFDSKDTIISKQEPCWHKDYNKIKEEHDELLLAVCEILCTNNSGSVSDSSKDYNCVCCGKCVIPQNTENDNKKDNNNDTLLKK